MSRALKIAITGGAGFIGSHLTKAYLDAGNDVLVIDTLLHGSRAAIDARARFYQVDIRDRKLQRIMQQERPDILSYHVSQRQQSQTSEQALADADVHVHGLLNVLDSCVAAAVSKLIFASAGNDLYAQVEGGQLPITEDAPLCPRHPSAISSAAGEWYVRYYTRQYGLSHTILRYADVYGETDHTYAHHPLSYLISMLLMQRAPIIRGTGNDLRDHIFIDDVVRANLCALKRGTNQTVHISSGRGSSVNSLWSMLARLLGSDIDPIHISGTLAGETAIALDHTRAGTKLDWYPAISLQEGVKLALQRWSGQPAADRITEPLSEVTPVKTDALVQVS